MRWVHLSKALIFSVNFVVVGESDNPTDGEDETIRDGIDIRLYHFLLMTVLLDNVSVLPPQT